ncbi:MAG: hypothetical protein NW223_19230 [Hyphomicrobiaceae bacterium]|nr:hypothetical protein [Hyphomicrobiaceae bacterium]
MSAPHPCLYLLADHLDMALATGEDMLAETVDLSDSDSAGKRDMDRLAQRNAELAAFLSRVRLLELSLIARLLQARKWAEEAKRADARLRPVIGLFVGGSASLVDAAAELGDTTSQSFETGDTMTSYLRTRAVLTSDEAGLGRRTEIAITDEFLVAGRVRLGTLLDLVAAFLDTLDLVGDLRIAQAPAIESASLSPN